MHDVGVVVFVDGLPISHLILPLLSLRLSEKDECKRTGKNLKDL